MTTAPNLVAEIEQEQAAQRHLMSSEGLLATARVIADLASATGATSIVGASREGLVLAGAVAATTGVPVWDGTSNMEGSVLVLESVLVTGAGLAKALDSLPQGASTIVVIAGAGPAIVPTWLEQSADKIIVLNNIT